jgi:hypothetical protein
MTTSAALSIRLAFAAALGPEADPPMMMILFLLLIEFSLRLMCIGQKMCQSSAQMVSARRQAIVAPVRPITTAKNEMGKFCKRSLIKSFSFFGEILAVFNRAHIDLNQCLGY